MSFLLAGSGKRLDKVRRLRLLIRKCTNGNTVSDLELVLGVDFPDLPRLKANRVSEDGYATAASCQCDRLHVCLNANLTRHARGPGFRQRWPNFLAQAIDRQHLAHGQQLCFFRPL